MTPTLYLTRNGLLEPLGQSQVLAYLRGLSKDHPVTLLRFKRGLLSSVVGTHFLIEIVRRLWIVSIRQTSRGA